MTSSSDFSDLFSQIGGLVALTCGAGIVWIVLMTLVAQRASERRRRVREGLPPLPGIHTQVLNLIRGTAKSSQSSIPALSERARTYAAPAAAPPQMAVPAPDLDLLTSDLPQPDLAAMFADDLIAEEPMPVHTEPSLEDFPLSDSESSAAPADAVELLRVWRDVSDGRLIVEIAGRQFTSLSELRSADLERRFLSVLRDLNAIAQSAAKVPPKTAAQPSQPQEPPRKDASEIPSMSPGAMFRQMGRVAMGHGPEPVEEKPELSIAEQIEELLQARIAGIAAYRSRSIHVKPSMHGGVRIEVDGKFYEGIGDVTETDVRDLLQSVVREWESHQ